MTKLEKVVEAAKAAKNQEAMEAALSKCAKKEFDEVLVAVCGEDVRAIYVSSQAKKADIVRLYAQRILEHLEQETFKAMNFEEKYEYLTDASREHAYKVDALYLLKDGEFEKLVRRLDLDRKDPHVFSNVGKKLSELAKKQRNEELASEPEQFEEEYSDVAGDNSHPEEDIPEDREVVEAATTKSGSDGEETTEIKASDLLYPLDELVRLSRKFKGVKPEKVNYPYDAKAPKMVDVEVEIAAEHGAGVAKVLHFFADYTRCYHMMRQKVSTLKEYAAAVFTPEKVPTKKGELVDLLHALSEAIEYTEEKANIEKVHAEMQQKAEVISEAAVSAATESEKVEPVEVEAGQTKEATKMEQSAVTKEFAVGQQLNIRLSGTWTVQKRTKGFVTLGDSARTVRCKVYQMSTGEEYIEFVRARSSKNPRKVVSSTRVMASEAIVSKPEVTEAKAESVEVVSTPKEEKTVQKTTVKGLKQLAKAIVSGPHGGKAEVRALFKGLKTMKKAELEAAIAEYKACFVMEPSEPKSSASAPASKPKARKSKAAKSKGAKKSAKGKKPVKIESAEAFHALSFEGKYEYLTDVMTSNHNRFRGMFLLTWDEVKQLCERLRVDPNMDREYLPMELNSKLRRIVEGKQVPLEIEEIERLAAGEEYIKLGEKIYKASFEAIEALCDKNGIELDEEDGASELPLKTRSKLLRQELYQYYLGTETSVYTLAC